MELKHFIFILKKNAPVLAAIVFVFILLSCGYSFWRARFFEGIYVISVSRTDLPVADKSADGYYLIESARLFGRRLGNLLALKKNDFARPVEIKQLTDFDYKISLKAETEAEIEETMAGLEASAILDLENFSRETGEYAAYSAVVSEVKIAKIKPDYAFVSAIAALGGLLLGIFVVLFREYLKTENHKSEI